MGSSTYKSFYDLTYELSGSLRSFISSQFRKQVIRKLRCSMRLFLNLQIVNLESKRQLLSFIRHCEAQIAAIIYWEKFIQNIIKTFYMIISFSFVFGSPLWIRFAFDYDFNLGVIPFENLISTALFMLLLVQPVFLLGRGKFIKFIWLSLILLILTVILGQVIQSLPNRSRLDPEAILIISFLFGQIGFLVCLHIVSILLIANKFFFDRIARVYFPEAVIINRLIIILSNLEDASKKWTFIRFRRVLLDDIEYVAECLQNGLYRRLRSGDIAMDEWFEGTTHQMAVAIRAKKV
jgi:hypothetical protein